MNKQLIETYLKDMGWVKRGCAWSKLDGDSYTLRSALVLQIESDSDELISAWYELKELKQKATAPAIRNIPLTKEQRDGIAMLWGALAESIMYDEAVASVALDHDVNCQTLCDIDEKYGDSDELAQDK